MNKIIKIFEKPFKVEDIVKNIVNELSENELSILERNERGEKYTFEEQLIFHFRNKYPFSLDGKDIEYYVGDIVSSKSQIFNKKCLNRCEINDFINEFKILFTDKKPPINGFMGFIGVMKILSYISLAVVFLLVKDHISEEIYKNGKIISLFI